MIFTSGFLGNMSGASLVVLPLVSIVSFLLYQMRVGKGAPPSVTVKGINYISHLRGVDHRSTPTFTSKSDLKSIYGNIPECARDVFVALHKEDGGKDRRPCKGLLIRDDIIITSKECSMSNFSFHFSGYGAVQANPHTALNSKNKMANSRLGFLEAHPPYHYHFIDQPVRRTRMFLSNRPNPRVNGTKSREAVIMTCGNKFQPIAHNFPSDNLEMVPLVELAGVVPKDILWEDRDLSTAPMLEYRSHRWWTRPISRVDEQLTIAEMFHEYDGPRGSISLPWAHTEFENKASAVMEAVDPRGHRRDCFEDYYIRWQQERPFSGLHFFDWLDFGPGKFLLEYNEVNTTYYDEDEIPPAAKYCKKKEFNVEKVHYFDDEMRTAHEIYFEPSKDGAKLIALYKKNGEPVPPSDMEDPHLYVWDLNKKWYMVDDRWDEEAYGIVKHSGVVAGKAALSGGKAYFGEGGALWGINFSSGHYRPDIQAAAMMYQWMKDHGFNLTAFHWVGRNGWSTEDCLSTNWGKIEIPEFTAVALNQSCHEVTTSPTWMLKGDV